MVQIDSVVDEEQHAEDMITHRTFLNQIWRDGFLGPEDPAVLVIPKYSSVSWLQALLSLRYAYSNPDSAFLFLSRLLLISAFKTEGNAGCNFSPEICDVFQVLCAPYLLLNKFYRKCSPFTSAYIDNDISGFISSVLHKKTTQHSRT